MGSMNRSQAWFCATRAALTLLLAASVGLSACSSGDSQPDETPAAPSGLAYVQPANLSVGDEVAALVPSVTGNVTTYSISPALPAGLTIDPSTGRISGVPQDEVDDQQYTVTATNAGGTTTATFRLSIAAKESVEPASDGRLELAGTINSKTFVNTASDVQFDVSGAQIDAASTANRVFINGSALSVPVAVSSTGVKFTGGLVEGRNDIVVLAQDTKGSALSAKTTLWAGSGSLKIIVRMAAGAPADGATVVAKLSDDLSVTATGVAAAGQVTLGNIPDRTILLTASSGNQISNVTTVGAAGSVEMTLAGLSQASTVDNNDFSQGLLGWNHGTTASIVPHVETIKVGSASAQTRPLGSRQDAARAFGFAPDLGAQPPKHALAAGDGPDLALITSGQGPRSASRVFNVAPGSANVKIRYRFITSEVPGGYFGSKYNDSYVVSMRSSGGAQVGDGNSMNGLGLASFSSEGSTAWRELTLPVTGTANEVVQIDLTVTNVGDGAYDSQLIVDLVSTDKLSVGASLTEACPNETVTFTAKGGAAAGVTWSSDGVPATGSGANYVTRFATAGQHTATASDSTSTANASVRVKEASGPQWVARFPGSTSVSDLEASFATNVSSFISALQSAGAGVSIAATFRPEERAYMMHYAYRIARKSLNPETVPPMDGVDICWVHRNAQGQVDLAASRTAAEQMVNGYGIVHPPALNSRHSLRLAIDMNISWTGDLSIANADGTTKKITSTPRTGSGNTELHAVGATYGVKKLVTDKPHWSDDGH